MEECRTGARGRGFETYLHRVVSLIKTLYSPKALIKTRERWLHPDITEKIILSLNTNKQNNLTLKKLHMFLENNIVGCVHPLYFPFNLFPNAEPY